MIITPKELKLRQEWSLDQKIDHTIGAIEQFHNYTNGKAVLMFSGGKDSTVLMYIARMIFPEMKAVFMNTTNEFSEILYFVKHSDNVDIVMPETTFIKTVDEYGFPLVDKMSARKIHDIKYPTGNNEATVRLYKTGINKKGEYHSASKLANKWMFLTKQKFDITNKCCKVLKHDPANKYQKKQDYTLLLEPWQKIAIQDEEII